ncbi:MAG: hypothetical protein AAFR47_02275 [Pseudomonadota bacterium]
MARIPDARALGRVTPQPAQARPNFSGLDQTGRALAGLGRDIAGASSAVVGALAQDQEAALRQEAFGVETRFLQYEQQWRQRYEERTANVDPGAAGFQESIQNDWNESAREFLGTVPEELKPDFDQQLVRLGGRITSRAGEFERQEGRRYARTRLTDGFQNLLNRQAEAPEDWQAIETEGLALIGASGLPAPEREELAQKWRQDRAAFDASLRMSVGDDEALFNELGAVSGYTAKLERVESGGDPGARNAKSSATGLHQFVDGTWLRLVAAHAPELIEGRTEAQVLALRKDAATSRRMLGHFTAENEASLRAAGLPVTDGTRYLAHFAGAGGAQALLQADPATPVSEIMSAQAIKANPSVLRGKAAGDVIAWANEKMAGDAVGIAEASPRYAGLEPSRRVALAERATKEREARRKVAEREYTRGFDSYVGALSAGAEVDPSITAQFTDERIDALVADPQMRDVMKAQRDDAVAASDFMRRMEGSTPAEVVQLFGEIEAMRSSPADSDADVAVAADRQRRAAALERALRADIKARQDDPAAYAQRSDAVRLQAAQIQEDGTGTEEFAGATLDEQARIGIPDHRQRALTKDRATEVVDTITRAEPDTRVQQMLGLERSYGEHWPRVLNQLRQSGLSSELYHAALVADDPVLSERIAALSGVTIADMKQGLDAGLDAPALKADLADAMLPFRTAFEAGDTTGAARDTFNELFAIAERLAVDEARRTGDASAAVAHVIERLIDSRYEVLEGSSVMAYVPAQFDAALVEDGAIAALSEEALEAVRPFGGDESAPEFIRQARIAQAAEDGVWVTSANGDGLTLMIEYENRLVPVQRRDGGVYAFTFAELVEMGTQPERSLSERLTVGGVPLPEAGRTIMDFIPDIDTGLTDWLRRNSPTIGDGSGPPIQGFEIPDE